MKLIVSYVIFYTTVDQVLLGNSSTMSDVHYEFISLLAPEYSACGSIQDIEAEFEAGRNYTDGNNHVANSQRKVKTLKVEIFSVEP
ncbi:hypothetical protein CP335_08385 [Pseudomonas fluorescens]|uniref:Uncharacterized protein n=1 Tax=Pseudomonas fluorescens TaxID=294 RepID=A0A854X3T2_PSEFL|nr:MULTISPECIES: hypothetical protein [Pseudomonas]PCM50208.1 hypothetical protein CP335_08385 [Pseudomonas fluorescens]